MFSVLKLTYCKLIYPSTRCQSNSSSTFSVNLVHIMIITIIISTRARTQGGVGVEPPPQNFVVVCVLEENPPPP